MCRDVCVVQLPSNKLKGKAIQFYCRDALVKIRALDLEKVSCGRQYNKRQRAKLEKIKYKITK